jgi:hypothetical protein
MFVDEQRWRTYGRGDAAKQELEGPEGPEGIRSYARRMGPGKKCVVGCVGCVVHTKT